MKRIGTLLLLGLIATPAFAQKDQSEKVNTKILQLPSYDISSIDPASINVEFAVGASSFGTEKLKDTKSTCVPKGGKLKDALEVTTYYYEVPYEAPSSYIVAKDASGTVVYASEISASESKTVKYGYDKCENWVAESMKKNWAEKAESFKAEEKKKAESSLYGKGVETAKNNVYASFVKDEFEVYGAKGKDFDYSDLDKAQELAIQAYESMNEKGPNEGDFGKLNQAISIWEKELESKDLEDKKARINTSIAKGLTENLANAYMYIYEMDKAIKAGVALQKLFGNFSNNRSQAWDARLDIMRSRQIAAANNSGIITDLPKLQAVAASAGKTQVNVKQLATTEFARLNDEYRTYRSTQGMAKVEAEQERYDEAVASGEVNPYQKYVTSSATQGSMIMMTSTLMTPTFSELPKEMCDLDLKQLVIMNNSIETVPAEIGKLTELTKLDLAGNKLKTLPKEIGQLKALKTLNLSKNPLESIPDEIQGCTSLKTVKLKGTKLSADQQKKLMDLLPNAKFKF